MPDDVVPQAEDECSGDAELVLEHWIEKVKEGTLKGVLNQIILGLSDPTVVPHTLDKELFTARGAALLTTACNSILHRRGEFGRSDIVLAALVGIVDLRRVFVSLGEHLAQETPDPTITAQFREQLEDLYMKLAIAYEMLPA